MELGSSISATSWVLFIAKSALLASFGARCPSVQNFECVHQCDSKDSSDVISDAVCSLRELFHLETGTHMRSFTWLPSLCRRWSLCTLGQTIFIDNTQTNAIQHLFPKTI
ncbi:hypothetical protein F4604DRAFT_310211 [Suillus subluteus]|nr:hypothetical protein F4604DRAFT_310211 [Suillus subluteus]